MPKVTINLRLIVTLDVPEEYAAKASRDDLIEMARASVPDSSVTPNGLPDGVQITLDSYCQEDEKGKPVFADVYHVEHDICDEPDIEFDDGGFTNAEGL